MITRRTVRLIPPFGNKLVDLVAQGSDRDLLLERTLASRSIHLSPRAMCDVELLATGAFSPLDSFMDRKTYVSVVREMCLLDGTPFPVPITLPVVDEERPREGERIVLRSPQNHIIALMTVEEIYPREHDFEALGVLGTLDTRHPLVTEMNGWGPWYISGPLSVLNLPAHYDFAELRLTPRGVRRILEEMGSSNVVAFQTRNPIHRAHEELTKRAAERVKGSLLIQPVVGLTKPGDVDHYTRVQCYKAMMRGYYDPRRTLFSLLPLAMRMAGPREAVWHAIIRRNFGANYFIVGRDHAGAGVDSAGKPFYGPYDAHDMILQFQTKLGITPLLFDELVHLPNEDRYEELRRVPDGTRIQRLSGTQVRDDYLAPGRSLPRWFTRPEVAAILANAYPPRDRQGFCVWFTGLSAAGKSTVAEVLRVNLMQRGRQVTLLDGDVVRTHLSKGLGFSREDRDVNIRRIGFVASEVVRHHGAVICAAVSPYRATRAECRTVIGCDRFIEVYVNTPLEICEQRDTKGLYLRARRGEIKGFTGIDDPYEPPENPDLVLDTTDAGPSENAEKVIRHLVERGFLRSTGEGN